MLNFFKIFAGENESQINQYSQLFSILAKEYPDISEQDLLITSCFAGLMARVAYVDFKIDPNELTQMESLLNNWKLNTHIHCELIVKMAVDHIIEMSGLENHLYVHPLREVLNKEERFKMLKALFLIAAADGNVESVEAEEIRLITKGLELSHRHFIAARAEVVEYLSILDR